jgi:Carboxypeptidase regulatory-like domain
MPVYSRSLIHIVWLCGILCFLSQASAVAASSIQGHISDPSGRVVVNAVVTLNSDGQKLRESVTGDDGGFVFNDLQPGAFIIKMAVPGFEEVSQSVIVTDIPVTANIQLKLATLQRSVTVTVNRQENDIFTPDPAERVLIPDEMLGANPGRPGAPVSVPGTPVESASGGIKAPQYFAPGVAGDHGEPIAQYIQIGNYLLPNNLSSNAHGNGYADPNILIPFTIANVSVDGGAFNVREGNHSDNLATIYALRSHVDPFLTVTGDYRDLDLVSGWTPKSPTDAWIMLQASYGNGLLDRLEHRQQYKANALRAFRSGPHELTVFALGYYGSSYVPGLVPIGVPNLHDTIDPRQKDQTHTGLIVASDSWHPTEGQQLFMSGFFRTYNLALYSNFGDGLIRQSEFPTVTGGNANYSVRLFGSTRFLAGLDYQRDAPRRLDLDHYISINPAVYGSFNNVTSNNVTIGDTAPYVAVAGTLTRYFRYYAGFRRDEISFENRDLLVAHHSFDKLIGVNSPKATLSYVSGDRSYVPSISLSAGEAFFTNDPRIGSGTTSGTLVSRSHAYQMVATKTLAATEFRLTLGHFTSEASLAKLDPDTGLQFNQGPGRIRYMTFAARRYFRGAMLEASVSKADARDLSSGQATPEAPRTIADLVGTLDRLPLHLNAKSEFEYVGAKPLGDGFIGVPVKEFRLALSRSFADGKATVSANMLIAKGYTGQTTEILALPEEPTALERVAGVRIPSYLSISCTYRFRSKNTR